MEKKFLILVVLLFILGCDEERLLSPGQSVQKLNTEFELKVGQWVSIDGEQISFKFESVPEDSRCPMNANCVWAGNAKVSLSLLETKCALNTTLDPHEITYSNHKIKLVSLTPYPFTEAPISQDAYIAKFIVSKE
jgi:hypothetical protein